MLQVPEFSGKNVILDPTGKVYVKYPIGNIYYKNKYDWKFTSDEETAYAVMEANKGHPLVLWKINGKFSHPIVATAGNDAYQKNVEFQKPYLIGRNDKVYHNVDENGFIYGRYEITEPKAQAFFRDFKNSVKNAFLPLYNSLAMVFDSAKHVMDNIKEGKVIHNALVSEPAWGLDSKIKGICIGADQQCDNELVYSGNIPCVICPEKEKLVYDFLDLLYSYVTETEQPNRFNILFAGDQPDMSGEQKTDEKKENITKDANVQDALKSVKNELSQEMKTQIDTELEKHFKVNEKNVVTDELSKNKDNTEKKENMIPESVVNQRLKDLEDKWSAKFEQFDTKFKTQDETINQYKANEKASAIGQLLLEYKPFFTHEGKVDTELFNKTLKYWTEKPDDLAKITEDMSNSLGIALNYINNYKPEIEHVETATAKKETTKLDDKDLTPDERRAKANEEYENAKEQLVKAGNSGNPIDEDAANFVSNRRKLLNKTLENENHAIVNNNQTVY